MQCSTNEIAKKITNCKTTVIRFSVFCCTQYSCWKGFYLCYRSKFHSIRIAEPNRFFTKAHTATQTNLLLKKNSVANISALPTIPATASV